MSLPGKEWNDGFARLFIDSIGPGIQAKLEGRAEGG